MGWATGQIAVRDKKLTPETPYILFNHLLGHRANPEHPLAGGAGTRDQIEMQETEEQRERETGDRTLVLYHEHDHVTNKTALCR